MIHQINIDSPCKGVEILLDATALADITTENEKCYSWFQEISGLHSMFFWYEELKNRKWSYALTGQWLLADRYLK